ncbi:AbrB/MazE/SpoVT family DNA-binding domain-containing protein [Hymenobacter cavernae]|nr:AbrB/MazE/SpoVT family DNA-binding domain-containing protein [Hymenobacter cavernae]
MKTRLIRVGNSKGIILHKKLLEQYHLTGEVNVEPTSEGVLITPVENAARQGWDERFQQAAAQGHTPDEELLEGFSDETLEDEWQW